MALQFSFRHFFHPLAIIRQRRLLDTTRNWTQPDWEEFQVRQLQPLLLHASRQIPWWRMRFAETGFDPRDFKTLNDLQRIPLLTRQEIQQAGLAMRSLDWQSRGAHPVMTSGTTGNQLSIWMDQKADVQEFCYYWKLWNEGGYHLGQTLAEFSNTAFHNHLKQDSQFEFLTRRLLLNSNWFTPKRTAIQLNEIRRRGCQFLKGSPAQLRTFAEFIRDSGETIQFKTIFCQGEILDLPTQRLLEASFSCRVIDSWGQMERCGAMASCSSGKLHLIPEYGIIEFLPLKDELNTNGTQCVQLAVTSLYNHAFPLFRYLTGDIAEVLKKPVICSCGRQTPTVERIIGRESQIIRTPDGRVLTSLFLVFEDFPAIRSGKFMIDNQGCLLIHIVPEKEFTDTVAGQIKARISQLAGATMNVEIIYHDSITAMQQA